jgi:hypothetical protein
VVAAVIMFRRGDVSLMSSSAWLTRRVSPEAVI